jgi:ubiquinone/menaquinone biosynthesis C-methylase UbiE
MMSWTNEEYNSEAQKKHEGRFEESIDGIFFAHQPIYGYRTKYAEGSHIGRYIITKSILNHLARYRFKNFIDIGGAEGYKANLVRHFFKAEVISTDHSPSVCRMAEEIYNIPSIACNIHDLPFRENEFDVVLCSETVEHVNDYKHAIDELIRITKNILVITVPHDPIEKVEENIRNNNIGAHINHFDIHTLDYLKERGFKVSYEKTLSPLLTFLRVLVEANKKPERNLIYKIYNGLTPVFRVFFGLGSANRMVQLDSWFVKIFRMYLGITFVIEKKDLECNEDHLEIFAKDFTNIKVEEKRV